MPDWRRNGRASCDSGGIGGPKGMFARILLFIGSANKINQFDPSIPYHSSIPYQSKHSCVQLPVCIRACGVFQDTERCALPSRMPTVSAMALQWATDRSVSVDRQVTHLPFISVLSIEKRIDSPLKRERECDIVASGLEICPPPLHM